MPNAKIQMSNECQSPKSKRAITPTFLSFEIFNLGPKHHFFHPIIPLFHCSNIPPLQYSTLHMLNRKLIMSPSWTG